MLALRMLHRLGKWHDARRVRSELDHLSDRMLADIGVVREDIGLVARGVLLTRRPPRF